jgi:hypothetical protein
MIKYFQIQLKILNRKIIAFGTPLVLAYILAPSLFVLFSEYLFSNVKFPQYIYVFVALFFVSKLSEAKRNGFLKSLFNRTDYLKLRFLENLLHTLPFILFLVYINKFVFALVLSFLALCMVLIKFGLNVTIPTPFSRKPFEFVIGFRNTFFMFPMVYFLTYISVTVSNFNLGIFSMLLLATICLTYYSKTEKKYYVWIFNRSPKEFLVQKTEICLTYFTALNMPILLALSVFFLNEIGIILVFVILCYTFLITVIFAKYSAFPSQMGLPQTILIGISVVFPPMLIVIIPFFYKRSIKQLKTIVE